MKTLLVHRPPSHFKTGDTLTRWLDVLKDPLLKHFYLFATSKDVGEGYTAMGYGPEYNLPLLVAFAEYQSGALMPPTYLLLDGFTLTAAVRPRYFEVRAVLDVAVDSQRTSFSVKRAPFTLSMAPAAAVEILLEHGPFIPLSSDSRVDYFALLSGITELQHASD